MFSVSAHHYCLFVEEEIFSSSRNESKLRIEVPPITTLLPNSLLTKCTDRVSSQVMPPMTKTMIGLDPPSTTPPMYSRSCLIRPLIRSGKISLAMNGRCWVQTLSAPRRLWMKFAVKGLDLSSNRDVDRTRLNLVICWIKS